MMKRIPQSTINTLSICAVAACYVGTLLALMGQKNSLDVVAQTYFFLYIIGLVPSLVVNLMSCFVCRTWPVRKLYFSDIFQLAGYGFGILILLTAVEFTGLVPENLKYYPPCVLALINSGITVIIRNALRDKK